MAYTAAAGYCAVSAESWQATVRGPLRSGRRAKAAMGVTCPLICRAGRVAGEHDPCLPSGEAHEGHPRSRRLPASHGRTGAEAGEVEIGQADCAAHFLDHLVPPLAVCLPFGPSQGQGERGARVSAQMRMYRSVSRTVFAPMGKTSSRRPLAMILTTQDRRPTSDASGSSAL